MLYEDQETAAHRKSEVKNSAHSAHILNHKPLRQLTQHILAQSGSSERAVDVFLLKDPLLSRQIEIHRLIEETLSALPRYIHRGYTLAVEPFRVSAGRCAVIQDSCGTRICLFEKNRAPAFSA
jgi:hypothetical protein